MAGAGPSADGKAAGRRSAACGRGGVRRAAAAQALTRLWERRAGGEMNGGRREGREPETAPPNGSGRPFAGPKALSPANPRARRSSAPLPRGWKGNGKRTGEAANGGSGRLAVARPEEGRQRGTGGRAAPPRPPSGLRGASF